MTQGMQQARVMVRLVLVETPPYVDCRRRVFVSN
jgi:hypothetical protein